MVRRLLTDGESIADMVRDNAADLFHAFAQGRMFYDVCDTDDLSKVPVFYGYSPHLHAQFVAGWLERQNQCHQIERDENKRKRGV